MQATPFTPFIMAKSKERKGLEKRNHDLWALIVKNRDDFTCQYCLKKKKVLNTHHIIGKGVSDALRYKTMNGITLCAIPCHLVTAENDPSFAFWVMEWLGETKWNILMASKRNYFNMSEFNLKIINGELKKELVEYE